MRHETNKRTSKNMLMLAGETAQKPHSILPRLLEVIEDRLPGSPGFGMAFLSLNDQNHL